jgi:hypothetical protein
VHQVKHYGFSITLSNENIRCLSSKTPQTNTVCLYSQAGIPDLK